VKSWIRIERDCETVWPNAVPTTEKFRESPGREERPLTVRVLLKLTVAEGALKVQVAGAIPVQLRATGTPKTGDPDVALGLMVNCTESVPLIRVTELGETDKPKSGWPVPFKAILRGLPGPSSEMVSVPDCAPTAVGSYWTWTIHPVPGAIVPVQGRRLE
jgi:hypothetical protein